MSKWDQRYVTEEFIFGTKPHNFVRRVRPYLPVAGRALDLATGGGRSGVFLAQYGLNTGGVDSLSVTVTKTEKVATLKDVDFAVRVADITTMRMPSGHYAIINSVCYHFAEPVRSRLAQSIVDALVSDGLFIGMFYHPEQATLEKESRDRTVLADMAELQTVLGGLKWLITEHYRIGKDGEARSAVCLLERKTLSDGI